MKLWILTVAAAVLLLQSSAALPLLDDSNQEIKNAFEAEDDAFERLEGTFGNEDDLELDSILSFPPILAKKWGSALVEGALIKQVLEEEENDVGANFDELTLLQLQFGKRTGHSKNLFGKPNSRDLKDTILQSVTKVEISKKPQQRVFSQTTTTTDPNELVTDSQHFTTEHDMEENGQESVSKSFNPFKLTTRSLDSLPLSVTPLPIEKDTVIIGSTAAIDGEITTETVETIEKQAEEIIEKIKTIGA